MLVSKLDNPAVTLIKMSGAIALPRILREAARMRLGHFLKDHPRSLEEIAAHYNYDAKILEMVIDVLVANGVIENANNYYVGTPLSDNLDIVDQLFVGIEGWHCWGALDKGLRSGKCVFPQIYNTNFFNYLENHPQQNANWKKWNTVSARAWMSDVADKLDLAENASVCDVGGGEGALLRLILESHPTCRGLLFERAEVVPESCTLFNIASGDMFAHVPAGMDNYVISRVFCNWNDEQSLVLLNTIRRSMHTKSKLYVIDGLMPDRGNPDRANFAANSLSLFLIFGSWIRTHSEFLHLFAQAGFRQVAKAEISNPTGFDFSLMTLQGC